MPTSELSPAQMRFPERWTLRKLPPSGHPDVGPFVHMLLLDSLRERVRLGLDDRWKSNYKLYRGHHWNDTPAILSGRSKGRLSLALLGANINRTVANLTARAPVAEVVSIDGEVDEVERILTFKMAEWNNKEEQQHLLSRSALNMEIYGITVEKAVYDNVSECGRIVVLDPYSFLPAPGYFEQLNDMPYVFHVYPMDIDECKAMFGAKSIAESDDIRSVLGEDREDEWTHAGTNQGSGNLPGNYASTKHPDDITGERSNRVLVAECWIRDYSTVKVDMPVYDEATGEQIGVEKVERPKYPGFIRKITVCNNGHVVLDDSINPNVNPALPDTYARNTFLYNHFPFFKVNSYEDSTSIWGFAMAELVGDINLAVDDLWSQIMAYLKMSLFPPLILPKDTKIPLSKIRYLPKLVLQPSSKSVGDGIKWLNLPNPPTWLFQALNVLTGFFDRISQIEDADRGQNSGGVIAASAVQMLQERGAVLIRAKIRAIDALVRMRGRCFLSFYQNFGHTPEQIKVDGEVVNARGIDFAESRFNYIVESGSTVAKTQAQMQELSLQLYQLKALDRQALLESLNWPNWKAVCERMAESDVAAAIQVLVEAGLPDIDAQAIMQFVMQPGQMAGGSATPVGTPQNGPRGSAGGGKGARSDPRPTEGNQPGQLGPMGQRGQVQKDVTAKAGAPAKPGKPKATQGAAQ